MVVCVLSLFACILLPVTWTCFKAAYLLMKTGATEIDEFKKEKKKARLQNNSAMDAYLTYRRDNFTTIERWKSLIGFITRFFMLAADAIDPAVNAFTFSQYTGNLRRNPLQNYVSAIVTGKQIGRAHV